MSIPVVLQKHEDAEGRCVYGFGSPDEEIGRVALDKTTGDVEILDLSGSDTPPGETFYLARVIPRLQSFHADGTWPESDRWEA